MPLDPPIPYPPDVVREALAPLRNDFSVALWAPGNAFAVGAVVRVAHSFLAREVFVVGPGGWYPKASMGMEKLEDVRQVRDLEELLVATAGRPLWAFEKERARRSLYDVAAFPRGLVFVFGSERDGLGEEMLARADEVVGIPIYGVNNSLPLAVAAGIAMSEWARRKYVEGLVI